MRRQVFLPVLAMLMLVFFIYHLRRPLPAPASAPQETVLHSQPTTLKNEDSPKNRQLNTVAESDPTITLEEWSRHQIIANIQQALNSTNEADQQDLTARLFPMLLARDPLAAATLAQNVEAVSLREELLRQVAKF